MPTRTLSESEFAAIKAKVLEHAPDGLKEDDFNRYVTPAMESAIGEAENSSAPLDGSALSRFADGAWKNLNPMGLLEAVKHPLDTASAIVQSHLSEAEKAKQAFKEGRYSEAMGHAAASALPVVGPIAAAAGERIGSGDIAGGLGEGAGVISAVEGPRIVKGAAKGTNAVATKVANSATAQQGLGAVAGYAAGASTGHPYIGVGLGAKYGAPVIKSLAELAQSATGGAPEAVDAATLAHLDRSVPVRASELTQAELLDRIKNGSGTPAVIQGRGRMGVAQPSAPIQAPVAAEAAPAVEAPPVKNVAQAVNEVAQEAKAANVRLSAAEVLEGSKLVSRGMPPDKAFENILAARELAARFGTPSDVAAAAEVAARKSRR